MIFFTADEHYAHANIIKYCNRPFSSVEDMDEELIRRHNEVVCDNDVTVHVGDFTFIDNSEVVQERYIRRLKGQHIFLQGSHDHWISKNCMFLWEEQVEGQFIVACHYAMRVWPRSHYGSWMVYGHSHGRLPPIGKQHDVGVDNNDFRPVSFGKLGEIMQTREDNLNLLRRGRNEDEE